METVVIQVRAPRGADPGRVIEGHYNIVGDTVILVDQSGKPLTSEDQKFSRKLNAGDNAKQIAAQERWRAGERDAVGAFIVQ